MDNTTERHRTWQFKLNETTQEDIVKIETNIKIKCVIFNLYSETRVTSGFFQLNGITSLGAAVNVFGFGDELKRCIVTSGGDWRYAKKAIMARSYIMVKNGRLRTTKTLAGEVCENDMFDQKADTVHSAIVESLPVKEVVTRNGGFGVILTPQVPILEPYKIMENNDPMIEYKKEQRIRLIWTDKCTIENEGWLRFNKMLKRIFYGINDRGTLMAYIQSFEQYPDDEVVISIKSTMKYQVLGIGDRRWQDLFDEHLKEGYRFIEDGKSKSVIIDPDGNITISEQKEDSPILKTNPVTEQVNMTERHRTWCFRIADGVSDDEKKLLSCKKFKRVLYTFTKESKVISGYLQFHSPSTGNATALALDMGKRLVSISGCERGWRNALSSFSKSEYVLIEESILKHGNLSL